MRSKFRGSALALLLMTSVVSTTVRAEPPVPAQPSVPKAESSPAVPKSETSAASSSGDAGIAQSDPQTLAQARELFWRAHALFEKGDYVEALRLFEQTYALRQEPEVLFNLALTHLRLNHCDQAQSLYQEYRAKVEPVADAANPPKELVELDEHCGAPATQITTRVPAPLAITVVKTTPPAPKPVASPAPAPVTPPDAVDSEPSPLRTIGWVAVGAAAVALGATVYFVVQQRQAVSDIPPHASGDEQAELEKDAEHAAKLATAMGITSGVLAAGGVTLLVVAPSTPAPSAAHPLTELGLGLQFAGSF